MREQPGGEHAGVRCAIRSCSASSCAAFLLACEELAARNQAVFAVELRRLAGLATGHPALTQHSEHLRRASAIANLAFPCPMTAEAAPLTRDYSTISPSALSLLLMKSQSELPYAKEAATVLWGDAAPSELSDALAEENARRRLRHFVSRYRSLDQLLGESGCSNVLELGAGLSFRGLELARTTSAFYVDTDLPDIIALKSDLIAKLPAHPARGSLRVQALNALDAAAFEATLGEFPSGPIAIANEGLLVYLNEREKAQLAANVRAALQARGGVWLTGDVYIQNPGGSAPNVSYGRSRAFLDQHRVEQNKFADWVVAERFFTANGFAITKKLAHEHPLHIRESWALALSR